MRSPLSSTELDLPATHLTVLDVLRTSIPGTHLTALEVWSRARALRPGIGFATVHRALARLHALEAVLKIDVPGGDGGAVYEPAAPAHAHLRCTACGALSDLAYAVPPATRLALARQHGVAIDDESITFVGRCAACVGKDSETANRG